MQTLLLTIRDIATTYGIAESTLRKMSMRKEGTPFFKIGGRVYAKRTEFDAWLNTDLSDMTVNNI